MTWRGMVRIPGNVFIDAMVLSLCVFAFTGWGAAIVVMLICAGLALVCGFLYDGSS